MDELSNKMHFNMIIAIVRKLKMKPEDFVDSYCDLDKNSEFMRGMAIHGEKKARESMSRVLTNLKNSINKKSNGRTRKSKR